jgi:hypothetical protein
MIRLLLVGQVEGGDRRVAIRTTRRIEIGIIRPYSSILTVTTRYRMVMTAMGSIIITIAMDRTGLTRDQTLTHRIILEA